MLRTCTPSKLSSIGLTERLLRAKPYLIVEHCSGQWIRPTKQRTRVGILVGEIISQIKLVHLDP